MVLCVALTYHLMAHWVLSPAQDYFLSFVVARKCRLSDNNLGHVQPFLNGAAFGAGIFSERVSIGCVARNGVATCLVRPCAVSYFSVCR